MVKKLGILGFILIVVAAAGMVWAETYTGAIPAPQPMVMPAAAPACVWSSRVRRHHAQGEGMKPQKLTTVHRSEDAVSRSRLCRPVAHDGPVGCAPPPPFLWRSPCGSSSFLGPPSFTICL